jgi:hypothetical protein
MGQLISVLPEIVKAISCQECARYVCNSMGVKSKCSDCCEFELETHEIDISPESDSEYSVEIDGCCIQGEARQSHQ